MSNKDDYYIKTDMEPIQDLLGGIPLGSITGFYGPPEAGKTTIAFQLGLEAAVKRGGNLLVFDTENKFHVYLGWVDAMEERFGVPINFVRVAPRAVNKGNKSKPNWTLEYDYKGKAQKDALNVFVVYNPDISPILIMFGRGGDISISTNSGKIKYSLMDGAWVGRIDETPAAKFIEENKIKAIIVDSITNPLDEFPTSGENLPARSDMTQSWLIQIQKLTAFYDLPVLAAIHQSVNDADPYRPGLEVEGGKGVRYNLAFVVYVMKEKNKALIPNKGLNIDPSPLPWTCRYLWNHRAPGQTSWTRFRGIEITDKGVVPWSSTSS